MRQQASWRWVMLALATTGAAAMTAIVGVGGFLIPILHLRHGLSLSAAGAVAAAPTLGLTLTLIVWGSLLDRYGERWIFGAGLAGAGAATWVAGLNPDPVWLGGWLLVAGLASGSTNAASGRIVIGYFPKEQRGLAMGVRQAAQPVGMGFAALVVPQLAERHGVESALTVLALGAFAMAALCWWLVRDPAVTTTAGAAEAPNPYRGSDFLPRIHLVSLLLVVPQFLAWTYFFTWLQLSRGWDEAAAGALVAFAQILGAAGRIGVGVWSDRAGSRTWTIRAVAVMVVVIFGALTAAQQAGWSVAVALFVLGLVASCADNGLSFTSVAEVAGPRWSGRAIGVQNTGQQLTASITPPLFGWMIGTVGYTWSFGAAALVAAATIPLIPKDHGELARTNRSSGP